MALNNNFKEFIVSFYEKYLDKTHPSSYNKQYNESMPTDLLKNIVNTEKQNNIEKKEKKEKKDKKEESENI